jgi:hypothetical protein
MRQDSAPGSPGTVSTLQQMILAGGDCNYRRFGSFGMRFIVDVGLRSDMAASGQNRMVRTSTFGR